MRRSRRSGSRRLRARARDWASSSMKVEKHNAEVASGEWRVASEKRTAFGPGAEAEVLAGDGGKRKLMSVGIRRKRGKRRRKDGGQRFKANEWREARKLTVDARKSKGKPSH